MSPEMTPPEVEAVRHEVLITRPEAEAEATARLVRKRGYVPVVAPLLRVVPQAVRWPVGFAATVVTSGNALGSLVGGTGPLFAVGDATAARARAMGFAEVHSASGDARDLVRLVRATCPVGCAVLLATGAGVGQEVAAGLRDAGFRVVRRVAYAARPVGRLPVAARAALAGGRVRAALFLSAETARVFGRVLPAGLQGALAEVEALAIGAAAAEALAPLPWRRVRVSLGPTLDQVLALL